MAMVISVNDQFEIVWQDPADIVWQDPADSNLRWGRDRLHLARPFPPLCQAFAVRLAIPFPPGSRVVYLNGYAFVSRAAPPAGPPPGISPSPVDWFRDLQPKAEESCLQLRNAAYGSMTAEELAQSLDGLIGDAIQVFGYTMQNDMGLIGTMTQFFAFLEERLGERGTVLGATLLQGLPNDSAASGKALAGLAKLAEAMPTVRDALLVGIYDLENVPGSAQFKLELDQFLDTYGWRAEAWGMSHVPVWAEDPATVLRFVAAHLGNQSLSDSPMSLAKEKRAETLAEVRGSLGQEDYERFSALLDTTSQIPAIGESRARWQLTAAGVLRVPILTLGRKLAQAGLFDAPDDIFFLYLDEVKALASDPEPVHSLIAARKADFKRWQTLEAPGSIGSAGAVGPAPGNPVLQAAFRLGLGIGAPASVEGNVIRGTAASRGTVRGIARVITSMGEADRFEAGNILVCQTSSPSWVPLFATAGGVVTDTGGVLTHSAVCARGYGIPCVVGTQRATKLIPEGTTVTVDGDQGTVTIE
jgi:rifampicin phosphotransferase